MVWCSVNVSTGDIIQHVCGKHMTLTLILQSDNPMQCSVVRRNKIVAEWKLVGVPAVNIYIIFMTLKSHKNASIFACNMVSSILYHNQKVQFTQLWHVHITPKLHSILVCINSKSNAVYLVQTAQVSSFCGS